MTTASEARQRPFALFGSKGFYGAMCARLKKRAFEVPRWSVSS